MKKIIVKSHIRTKTPKQLKKAICFEDMLPTTVKSHTRKILKR
jgi:hypothetical protein